jgi:hypothetical protein
MNIAAVYKLGRCEACEWLLPIHEADFDNLRFDGQSRRSNWQSLLMKRLRISSDGRDLKPCDFPACSGPDMLFVSATVADRIGDYLAGFGELLPLAGEAEGFFAMNVTTFVDALDENESTLLRSSTTGRTLMVNKHVFTNDAHADAEIFKIPQTPRGLIYVTQRFVTRIEELGFTGLEFVRL